MIAQLNPTIDVHTPLGDCEAMFIIDYGLNYNTVWVCRMPGGEIKHFYSDDIRIYDNPMNGKGWDVGTTVNKIPSDAKRDMSFMEKDKTNNSQYVEYCFKKDTVKINDTDDINDTADANDPLRCVADKKEKATTYNIDYGNFNQMREVMRKEKEEEEIKLNK